MPDLDRCEAINEFLGIEWPCGQQPAALYRRICVHEHVRDGLLCAEHVELNARGLCRTCYELPGDLAHECPITIMPLAGEEAIP